MPSHPALLLSIKSRLAGAARFSRFLWLALALLAGSLLFLAAYGKAPLPFTNINWIYNNRGDQLQHFLGWQFFRGEPWNLPPGRIDSYGYPSGTSLAYTDAIPLLALPLKLLQPLLPARFQYFGIWTLLGFSLQCGFALLILAEFTPNPLNQVLGAALLTLAPPMLWRVFLHEALGAHWILLAALYLLLLARRRTIPAWIWSALAFLAALVHAYFIPVVLGVYLASLLENLSRPPGVKMNLPALSRRLLLPLGLAVLAGAAAGWLAGLFSLGEDELAAYGYGLYALNLNALFNPMEYARLLPALPVYAPAQNEGFNYLGAGLLALLALALLTLISRPPTRTSLCRNGWLVGLAALLTLFALSSRVTLGSRLLFELPLPGWLEQAASVFRSSGRFFWLPFYLLALFAVLRTVRLGRFAPLILLAALTLQWFDLQPLIAGRRFQQAQVYRSPLQSEFWRAAGQGSTRFEHLLLLPASRRYAAYAPYAIYAAENRLTLNWGYFARGAYGQIAAHGEQEIQRLKAGSPDPASIYVFCEMALVDEIGLERSLSFYQVDDTVVGIFDQTPLARHILLEGMTRLHPGDLQAAHLSVYLKTAAPGQIILLSGKDLPFAGFDERTGQALGALGLRQPIDPASTDNVIAIFGASSQPLWESSPLPLRRVFVKGQAQEGITLPFDLTLVSANQAEVRQSSIVIDGREMSLNKSGLNLAVYDPQTRQVTARAFTRAYPVTCP